MMLVNEGAMGGARGRGLEHEQGIEPPRGGTVAGWMDGFDRGGFRGGWLLLVGLDRWKDEAGNWLTGDPEEKTKRR